MIGVLAAASFVAAIVHQKSATEPIGEGEVFVADAGHAAEVIAEAESPTQGVRHARNDLDVEAVSLVSSEGMVVASTSSTLQGQPVTNPLLAYGARTGRFAALAVAVDQTIETDGVEEWPVGSVLYQVVSPMKSGNGLVLLHYDVEELISRRTQPGEIQTLTLQLVALGGIFAVLGTAVGIGHSRVSRRHREMTHESELLRAKARELAEANAELAEARHRAERARSLAEEKMRIRSEFVLMINHELRTPLTSVVTGAELVRDGDLGSAEQREVIDSMVANGKRLNEIIDQILAVARIENRGLSNELVEITLADVCATLGTAQLASAPPDLLVRTDVPTVGLVLSSLADNARTHGASNVEVRCVTEPVIDGMAKVGVRPGRAVYFIVADDGPGIDPAFLPRAFEKFEKNSRSPGTGLGLYMVRLMVEAIEGSIEVDTSPRGTVFQIALPARAPERVMVQA